MHPRERPAPLCLDSRQLIHLFSLCNAAPSLLAESWSEINTDLRDLVGLWMILFFLVSCFRILSLIRALAVLDPLHILKMNGISTARL